MRVSEPAWKLAPEPKLPLTAPAESVRFTPKPEWPSIMALTASAALSPGGRAVAALSATAMAGATRNAATIVVAGRICAGLITTAAADTLTLTAATTTEAIAITATFPRITTPLLITAGLTTHGQCLWRTDGVGDL